MTEASDAVKNVLAHHGVRGMRWGVRRGRGSGGSAPRKTSTPKPPKSEDASKAHKSASSAKSHGTDHLSNHELQHLVNRMNLEQQYSRLSSTSKASRVSAGKKFTKEILGNVAKQQVTKLANEGATKLIAKTLIKGAVAAV